MAHKKHPGGLFQKDETGSLTIFSLFIFILILMMAGMAVDMVRHERERVKIQNTIDTAVVAASSLTQEAETQAEVEALIKDHMAKAGLNPDIVTVTSDVARPAGNDEITSRWVSATADYQMDTMFMNMMGIESLPGGASSGAREGNQMIEIALVLDTSGSMDGEKMDNLKIAAKQFINTVLTNNSPERTLISIIPYSQQVHMNDDLKARLSLNTDAVAVTPVPTNPNAIATYIPGNTATNCVRFRTDDFTNRRLVDGTDIELLGNFRIGSTGNFSTPTGGSRWCRSTKLEMMLFQNNETDLGLHIDAMDASGWTAVDYGMNWGVGVLDPSFQSVVTGMITDGLAPATAAGFPVAHGTEDVLKYVVLMTDGINTRQRDLEDPFKSGPSRIWHSETRADEAANGHDWFGYVVEMPDNPPGQRWYAPGLPTTTADDTYIPEGHPDVADAVQWDHHAVFDRFSVPEAADYFFSRSDTDAFDAYNGAVETNMGWATADTDLRAICSAARTNEWIEIFTVAFEAPEAANTLLAECSAKEGNHFDVAGTDISAAFAAIAAEITKLRLTQ
jgi:Flp pilus assembly protein TadG